MHSRGAAPELPHDYVALHLVHVPVQSGDGVVSRTHRVGEPVDPARRVDIDNGLSGREHLVQVEKGVEFPLVLFAVDIELLDRGKDDTMTVLQQHSDWVGHK